jgi:hypothetical protein
MSNIDVHSQDQRRVIQQKHWSRESQPFAPAEILINHLENGWSLNQIVHVKTHQYGGGRTIQIYFFTICWNGESIELPVQANPVIRRLIVERKLNVIPLDSGSAAVQ